MQATLAQTKPSLLQRIAQRQVFAVLRQLQNAGLTIEQDGNRIFFGDQHADLQATIEVKNPAFYWRSLVGGSIGAAESFVEEQWQTENLSLVLQVFARCLPVVERLEKRFAWLRRPVNLWLRYRNRNTRDGSRTNIAAHYDLGNAMYEQFLDPLMQYSSAIFPSPQATLEQAQQHKLQRICEQLKLTPNDHLLEIGTGWGGLACYAAKNYGCRVTTTTISKEQYKIATQRAIEMGVADKITFLLQDYRDLHGQYDKIVSIEMIEAVGHEYFGDYFACLDRHLKPEGVLLIQAITIADQRYDSYRSSVDFINRYIFPGGCLPSVSCQRQSNFDPLGGKVKLTHPRRFIRYCAGLELGLCQRLSYLSVDSCSQRSVQYVHGVAADRARPLLTFGHQRRRLTTGRTASCSSR